MPNHHIETGGIDPRLIEHVNGNGKVPSTNGVEDQSLLNGDKKIFENEQIISTNGISNVPGLHGSYEIDLPNEFVHQNGNGNGHIIPSEIVYPSSIIKEANMYDQTGEMVNTGKLDTLNVADNEVLVRLHTDFEAIAKTGQGAGMNEAHSVLLEDLYSPQFVPVLQSLLDSTESAGNNEGSVHVRAAIQALDNSLNEVRSLSQIKNRNLYHSFLDAHNSKDSQLNRNLRTAQLQATKCIEQYSTSLSDPALIKQATDVYGRFIEREIGLELPKGFVERLFDPNTKVLAAQLDFNSTFNVRETIANPGLNNEAQHSIRSLVETFKAKFPDKKITLSINTGRPGQYAWGVHEASIPSMPEIRQWAFAESGGVIVTNLESGAMEVAVEKPQEWQHELKGIESFIKAQIANPKDFMIEDKKSMLSLRLAKKHGGEYLLKTKDGQPVTSEWIAEQVENYFLNTQNELGVEFDGLMQDLEHNFPDAHKYIVDQFNSNGDIQTGEHTANGNGELKNKKSQVLKTLKTVFNIAESELMERINHIDSRLDTIDIMYLQGLLQAKYNPTAGYVDIAHAHLNKYSTSMTKICKEYGVTRDQVLWFILGDSSTDIIPEELTGHGEPNEGAADAFMFAVQNRNTKMEAALQRRGEKGVSLSNHSTLAVIALMKGIEKSIQAN